MEYLTWGSETKLLLLLDYSFCPSFYTERRQVKWCMVLRKKRTEFNLSLLFITFIMPSTTGWESIKVVNQLGTTIKTSCLLPWSIIGTYIPDFRYHVKTMHRNNNQFFFTKERWIIQRMENLEQKLAKILKRSNLRSE